MRGVRKIKRIASYRITTPPETIPFKAKLEELKALQKYEKIDLFADAGVNIINGYAAGGIIIQGDIEEV